MLTTHYRGILRIFAAFVVPAARKGIVLCRLCIVLVVWGRSAVFGPPLAIPQEEITRRDRSPHPTRWSERPVRGA